MMPLENWGSGEAYEGWIGRWSRPVAREFLRWISVPPGARWADVGCGTGALSETIAAQGEPASVAGCDRSSAYVEHARANAGSHNLKFEVGDALALPWPDTSFDATVSGLVLNFVPDHAGMAAEMKRVTRRGGRVAAYVWDYAGGMQMLRHFWDVAIALHRGDSKLDQAERFPICDPTALAQLFDTAGLRDVEARAIDVPMVFRDFEDFWHPFLGKQGPAPTYLASLPQDHQDRIRETLRDRLRPAEDGSIHLTARAWAVRGTVD